MKKIKFTIKTAIILITMLVASIFFGCEQSPKKMGEDFQIVEIDSCEYIVKYYDLNYLFSHKGNCRYCEYRSKKQLTK